MKSFDNRVRNVQRFMTDVLRRDDRGIALPMVILVFIVGVALIAAFLVAIVGSSRVTAISKENVQAQAAAEAGIADAVSRIDVADVCKILAVGPIADTKPRYEVEVSFGSGATWNRTCPSESTELKIRSTGHAAGLTAIVERTYLVSATTPPPSGSTALRTADGLTIAGDAHMNTVDPGSPVDLLVETGDLVCSASGRIEGSVYVLKGKATISGSCPIAGNLVVFGDVNITGSGQIEGDIVSTSGSVTLSGGAKVGGNVYAKKNFVRSNGKVDGSVFAGAAASLEGGAPAVQGILQYGTTFTIAWGSNADWVKGGPVVRTDSSGVPRPGLPAIPPWADVTLAQVKSQGFSESMWEGACTVAGGTPHAYFSSVIPTFKTKTVVNALSCGTLATKGGVDLKIATDLVIMSNRITLNNVRINSADGQPHRVWFVVPSDAACPPAGTPAILLENSVKFPDGKISALAYTKCDVEFKNAGNDPWPGSVYARKFSGYPAMNYRPVGLPGSAGEGSGGASGIVSISGTLDTPLSHRNVN